MMGFFRGCEAEEELSSQHEPDEDTASVEEAAGGATHLLPCREEDLGASTPSLMQGRDLGYRRLLSPDEGEPARLLGNSVLHAVTSRDVLGPNKDLTRTISCQEKYFPACKVNILQKVYPEVQQ